MDVILTVETEGQINTS